jgi:bifunctional non-homologous end joining protein LigD
VKVEGKEIEVSNQDKILFPETGITKGELIAYYRDISDYMLPFIEHRPLVLRRFPDGINEEGFYQKEASDYFPDWITTAEVPLKKGGSQHLAVADSAATLVYLADQAVITPHAWLSTVDTLHHPDRMVIDLDPSGDDFPTVKSGARKLREIFDSRGYEPRVMTTGSSGVHVVAFLDGSRDFEAVRSEAAEIAEELVGEDPERFTTEQLKEKRGDRVFIDVARNAYGQTSASPYAARARPGAPVATPLEWSELDREDVSPRSYTIRNVLDRLSGIQAPWKAT